MEITPLFAGMDVTASGLAAQRKRMNAIADNIANAETTHTAEGGPYRKKEPQLASATPQFAQELDQLGSTNENLLRSDPGHLKARMTDDSESYQFGGVKANIAQAKNPFREVYNPNHPDADQNGMVKMPNVDIVEEMTELISASRSFEANVTAFNASKGMMKKALEL
jgi:flagellar basal-body rod protein FlgC